MANRKFSFVCPRHSAEIWEGLFAGLDPKAIVGQEAIRTDKGQDLTSGESVRLLVFLGQHVSDHHVASLVDIGEKICGEKIELLEEMLPQEDWVSKSQQGLECLRVGRLRIISTQEDQEDRPFSLGQRVIKIGAANAFGTGHHGTTLGCLHRLQAIDKRTRRPLARRLRVADVGAGTALLAFAAAKLFRPRTAVLASDIDQRSLPTAQRNAKMNALHKSVKLFQAADVSHPRYRTGAGFDLVFANILSGLLVDMAPRLSQVVHHRGTLVLAGLLNHHAVTVARCYQLLGYRLISIDKSGDWSILQLKRVRLCKARVTRRGSQRFHSPQSRSWMDW